MALDPTVSYYDKVLAAVGVSLGGGTLAGAILPYQLRLGVLAGSLVATVFIYDAMFRNPPPPAVARRAQAAAFVWHIFLGILLLPYL